MAGRAKARRQLLDRFDDGGYVRVPNPERQRIDGSGTYKKGYEARLLADTLGQVRQICRDLKIAGFTPGAPFPKGSRIVVPVYGRKAVEYFVGRI